MAKAIIYMQYDVIVVGGGLSGVCAAIAGARNGAKTALIQNRPVLGGNASSEIRMHICGADYHGSRPDARETGILEEILLESKKRNPQNSFSILDTILWEKTHFQDGLDLYLNTHMASVETKDNRITGIIAEQLTTERIFEMKGDIFIDTTGDGTLGYLAGAHYMTGREGKNVFGEKYAPVESDFYTMGNSLLFKAVDVGYPVSFEKPSWANTYTEEALAYRDHQELTSGYWWIELGGDDTDVIMDGEVIRDELLKAVYGVWDHIKNSGHHCSDNLVLDWIGFLPGKRESRRLIGDYILKEQDLFEGKVFEDAVAYGGWPMDMHIVGGLKTRLEPTDFIGVDEVYTIPYRSLYSKNIRNLMMGGRVISASHMAFGSTRVMATCAVIGQAIGSAAALAIEYGIDPKGVSDHMKKLQQLLIKDDCYIPGYDNQDEDDLAVGTKVSCSSQSEGGDGINVINGISRKVGDDNNCWISDGIATEGEWIELDLGGVAAIKELHLKFDSDLSKEIMVTLSHSHQQDQVKGIPPQLVKAYCIECLLGDQVVYKESVNNNYLRFKRHIFRQVECDKIRVHVFNTNGDSNARIFELRAY